MSEFHPGEIVNIYIKGARVLEAWQVDQTGETWMQVNYDRTRADIRIGLGAKSVTVERVALAEWPPQPGDLWRDKYGSRWFAFRDPRGRVLMQASDPSTDARPLPDELSAHLGPLTLVDREGGEQP